MQCQSNNRNQSILTTKACNDMATAEIAQLQNQAIATLSMKQLKSILKENGMKNMKGMSLSDLRQAVSMLPSKEILIHLTTTAAAKEDDEEKEAESKSSSD